MDMYIRYFAAFFLLLVYCCTATAEEPRIDTERATVIMRNGEGHAGYIWGVDDDSLTLLRIAMTDVELAPSEEKRKPRRKRQAVPEPVFVHVADTVFVRLARRDIRRVVAQETRKTWRGFTYGSLSLLYTILSGFALNTKQPGAYLKAGGGMSKWPGASLLIAPIPVVGVGGGIGAIADQGRNDAKVFFFTEEGNTQEWERFRHFLAGGDAPRWRVSIASSMVVEKMGRQFEQYTTDAAFTLTREQPGRFPTDIFGAGHKLSNPSDVNVFRRVQLQYALTPHTDIGASVVWLGEPIFFARKEYRGKDYPFSVAREDIVAQRIAGRGYYAMGMYNVRPSFLGGLTAALGAGVGLAFMEFQTESHIIVAAQDGEKGESVSHYSATSTKTLASGVVVAELSGHLYPSLSLGITADYAFAPVAVELLAVPEVSFPVQRFTPGNASIGLTVGVHF